MTRPVVFLGPSLPWQEAYEILDADYRPPVKRGDLGHVAGARLIGIIDGVFLQHCSVGHREIMALLNRGVGVVGGGSMGALRAAELRPYGMIGVGRIYELYSTGTIEGDDEVALVFDPETLEPLSEPMVNLRCLLDEALSHGAISDGERGAMLGRLRSLYYPRRTIPAFLGIAREVLGDIRAEGFDRFFAENYRDVKKEDAIAVLRHLKKMSE